MSVTQKLTEEIVSTKFGDIPTLALERLKMAIMDDVGISCMSYDILNKPLVQFAKSVGGIAESTIIGDGGKVSCGLAAGVNAEMAGDSNFGETSRPIHPLSPIAQTGIAVGERIGASGRDVITAIAISYELCQRLAANNLYQTSPGHSSWNPATRRSQPLSVAICAAKLLMLKEKDINHALGLAWMYLPPDMKLFGKSFWPKEHYLWACQIGIQAALLVQNGYGGPDDILDKEGEMYKLENLAKSPDPFHYVINEPMLKQWIGSYGYMCGIDIIAKIFKEERLGPEDIVSIIARVNGHYVTGEFGPIIQNTAPKDFWNARNSIPWSFALAALGYPAGQEWYTQERFTDPVCLNLAAKVKLERIEIGEDLENEVEVITKKGTFKRREKIDSALGSPRQPMSWEQVESKFIRLVKPIVGEHQAKDMANIFREFEDLADIRELTRYFG